MHQLQVLLHQVTEVKLPGQEEEGWALLGCFCRNTSANGCCILSRLLKTNLYTHSSNLRAALAQSAAITQPDHVASLTGIAGSGAAHMFLQDRAATWCSITWLLSGTSSESAEQLG